MDKPQTFTAMYPIECNGKMIEKGTKVRIDVIREMQEVTFVDFSTWSYGVEEAEQPPKKYFRSTITTFRNAFL